MTVWDFNEEYVLTIMKLPSIPSRAYPSSNENQEQDRWNLEKDTLKLQKEDAYQRWLQHLIYFIEEQANCNSEAAYKMWEICNWDFEKLETLIKEYSAIKLLDN